MAAFHYLVKAKLIQHVKESGEIEFLEFENKFENENPIEARNLAFRHFQNYIDVLLEAKHKTYQSDKQAREELKSFIDPGTKTKIQFGESEIEFSSVFGNGIGIFLIVDVPRPGDNDEVGEEIFIHGIGYISYISEDTDLLIYDLQREYEYYTFYEYSTDGKEKEVVYCNIEDWERGYRDDASATYHILETPFDWTGLDKPYWWGNPDEEQIEETEKAPRTLEEIIRDGETNQVEFKPALLYNFSTGKAGIGIKGIIAKSICAFLNSNGGFLIIGVTDNGEPQGLSYDYSLAGKKKEKDFFMLEFDQMLEHFLSFSVKNNVSGQFYEYNEKEIFVVTITPSKRRPVFLKGQNGKEFYVRGEASSRRLTDIEELVNYCIEKWG